jgi:hypothetical protein
MFGGGGAAAGLTAPTSVPPPPGIGGSPDIAKYRVYNRDWGDQKRLDLVTQPEAYLTWRDRALGHLCKDRPELRRLLLWAERQEEEISASALAQAAEEHGLQEGRAGAELVGFTLFEGLKYTLSDSLLGRARLCSENGFELWRRLHTEWEGCAPQVRHAKAQRYQDPQRCANVAQLWDALPKWLQLGVELEAAAFQVPEWLKCTALEKLLPQELLEAVVSRPTELDTFAKRLSFVKAQMGHARGVSQAKLVATGRRGKEEDVHMGALSPETGDTTSGLTWNLHSELQRCSQSGDWAGVSALGYALQALGKGQGKGKGKGKGFEKGGGKGFPWGVKGPPSKGAGKGGGKAGTGGFEGYCYYCGAYGHRKSACPQLDKEMAARRPTKGAGKGLYATEEEEEGAAAEGTDSSQEWGALAEGEDQWWMGSLNSVSKPAPECCSCRRPGPCAAQRRSFGRPSYYAALLGHEREEECDYHEDCDVLALVREEEPGSHAADKAVYAVSGTKGRLVEAVVDSGAEESVAPPGLFPGKVGPSPMSRAGKRYKAANGSRIPNLGQQRVDFTSGEGHRCGMPFQVAEVERPLVAVSQLAAAGNTVLLEKDSGVIRHVKSGREIKLQRRGGVYIMRMYLQGQGDAPAGFTRPGR